MATANPFDLLGDNDNDDPSQLIAAQQEKIVSKKAAPTQPTAGAPQQPKQSKLPSKPLPPAQAVRESKNEAGRGGGRGGGSGGRGYGRGRGGGGGGVYNRDSTNNENSYGNSGLPAPPEEGESGKSSERRTGYGGGPRGGASRGGRRSGFSNGELGNGERPRREYERRSGSFRGTELKREGAGRGNWGTPTDEIAQVTEEVVNDSEKGLGAEKPAGEEEVVDGSKDTVATESEEKEPEDKEMTLEEYEKVLEEKRKALQALKTEERKVGLDKEFESMQQLSSKKKGSDDIFIKLGSDKDKRKEAAEKEEKAKKSLSINEFLKPAEGERYYNPGGRGGRGRGRGGSRGGYGGGANPSYAASAAPSIEDPGHFPTLGAK